MNLDRWSVDVDYIPEVNDHNSDLVASCNSDWRYKQLNLRCYVPKMAKMSDMAIEYILVHELCHALVCGMRNRKSKMDLEEMTVTEISRAFMRNKYPNFRPTV